MLHMAITKGAVEMRSIEAGRGAVMPSLRHAKTHLSLFVLNGTLKLTLNGVAHELRDGDFANIPAGTAYGTEVTSGHARWVYSAANGDGLDYWTTAGEPTESFAFDGQVEGIGGQALAVASGADVEVAG